MTKGKNQYDGLHCKRGHLLAGDNVYVFPDGKRNCRICAEVSKAKWAANNKEEHRLQSQQYKERNQEKCKAANLLQKCKRAGFTKETFKERLEEQEHRCAICKKILNERKDTCMDHEHVDPPKPRGILCRQCNIGIGCLQDNPDILEAAAAYLRKYSKEVTQCVHS